MSGTASPAFAAARWEFASTASTIDLIRLGSGPLTPQDSHWKHTCSTWLFVVVTLAAISTLYLGYVRWKLRLKSH
jgi:hypothetical protein